jgi:hypothetical protein
VDRANTTGTEDGTFEHPYTTAGKGVAAAPPGALVGLRGNTYTGPQTINKPVTLATYGGATTVR